jgi:hypothetical protein
MLSGRIPKVHRVAERVLIGHRLSLATGGFDEELWEILVESTPELSILRPLRTLTTDLHFSSSHHTSSFPSLFLV